MNPPISAFWGKAHLDKNGNLIAWLPLHEHCLDVAITFRALLDLPMVRQRLETAAGQSLTASDLDRLAVFALLHDVGKFNHGFQEKILHSNTYKAGHIRELAPLFFEDALCERFATVLDIETLLSWFTEPAACEALLIASISHHGTPICFESSDRTGNYHKAKTEWWKPNNERDPFAGIAELLALARRVFPSAFSAQNTICAPPMLQHYFAGLVMLADWIGSHQGFFPFDSGIAERSICR